MSLAQTHGSAQHVRMTPGESGAGISCGVMQQARWFGSALTFTEAGAADDVADAASEYVIQLQDGGFVSIVDQGFGIGLLGLGPDTKPPADMGGDADISMNEDTHPMTESRLSLATMPTEDDDSESPEDAFEADDAENGDDSETDRTEDDRLRG